jgi:hypothetical protein
MVISAALPRFCLGIASKVIDMADLLHEITWSNEQIANGFCHLTREGLDFSQPEAFINFGDTYQLRLQADRNGLYKCKDGSGKMADEFETPDFSNPFIPEDEPRVILENMMKRYVKERPNSPYLIAACHGVERRQQMGLPEVPLCSTERLLSTRRHFPGIHSTYAYLSSGLSFSASHKEDFGLQSANVLYHGSPKIWVVIKPRHSNLLEANLVRGGFACSQSVRHLNVMPAPHTLENWGVEFKVIIQNPGDLIITDYDVYHYVWNTGPNLAEAVNLCDAKWFPPPAYVPCEPDICPGDIHITMKDMKIGRPRVLDIIEDRVDPEDADKIATSEDEIGTKGPHDLHEYGAADRSDDAGEKDDKDYEDDDEITEDDKNDDVKDEKDELRKGEGTKQLEEMEDRVEETEGKEENRETGRQAAGGCTPPASTISRTDADADDMTNIDQNLGVEDSFDHDFNYSWTPSSVILDGECDDTFFAFTEELRATSVARARGDQTIDLNGLTLSPRRPVDVVDLTADDVDSSLGDDLFVSDSPARALDLPSLNQPETTEALVQQVLSYPDLFRWPSGDTRNMQALTTLCGQTWLNDLVVNEVLVKLTSEDDNVCFVDSVHLQRKFLQNNFDVLPSLADCRLLLAPFFVNNHWFLISADFSQSKLVCHDETTHPLHMEYLQAAMTRDLDSNLDWKSWTVVGCDEVCSMQYATVFMFLTILDSL